MAAGRAPTGPGAAPGRPIMPRERGRRARGHGSGYPTAYPQPRIVRINGAPPATSSFRRRLCTWTSRALQSDSTSPVQTLRVSRRYRIVAVIDETPIWNESVTVEVGKDTTLTLSQSSSPVPADRFPPPAASGAEGSPGSQRE